MQWTNKNTHNWDTNCLNPLRSVPVKFLHRLPFHMFLDASEDLNSAHSFPCQASALLNQLLLLLKIAQLRFALPSRGVETHLRGVARRSLFASVLEHDGQLLGFTTCLGLPSLRVLGKRRGDLCWKCLEGNEKYRYLKDHVLESEYPYALLQKAS